jgi:hypothetical protein
MQGCRRFGAVAAVAGALLAAPAADARVYGVHTCALPNGTPVAIGDAASGWKPSIRAGTTFMTLDDRCPSRGGIYAHLGSAPAYGAGGAWYYQPPPDTSLAGFDITWGGTVSGGGEASLSRSDQPDPTYVERWPGPFGEHTVSAHGLDIASVAAIAACSFAQPSCGADPVDFTIRRARMELNDLQAPTVSDVSGELVSAPLLRGTMPVRFNGRDVGGGLFRVVVTINGGMRAAGAVPDAAGRCRDPEPNDSQPYEFAYPRPCPLQVQGEASVNTTALPDGTHMIGVYLEDAAGNRATLAAPALRTVQNGRGAVNGTNGGDGATIARRGRRRVTTSFGRRRIALRGTLTRGGQPVGGAVLDVLQRVRLRRAAYVKVGEVVTRPSGRYRIRAPGGPSRTLRVAYRAHVNDTAPAASADVRQSVRGGLRLRARRTRIGLRGLARFSGRVLGGRVPARGKVVELQAQEGGSWRLVDTVRSDRSGRFTARYRFRRITSGRSFRFRAVARAEFGWPYLRGASRSVPVRVG